MNVRLSEMFHVLFPKNTGVIKTKYETFRSHLSYLGDYAMNFLAVLKSWVKKIYKNFETLFDLDCILCF